MDGQTFVAFLAIDDATLCLPLVRHLERPDLRRRPVGAVRICGEGGPAFGPGRCIQLHAVSIKERIRDAFRKVELYGSLAIAVRGGRCADVLAANGELHR